MKFTLRELCILADLVNENALNNENYTTKDLDIIVKKIQEEMCVKLKLREGDK